MTLTQNRPKAHNANTRKMREELLHFYWEVNNNDLGEQVSMQLYEVNKLIIAAINGDAVRVVITTILPMDNRIIKFLLGGRLNEENRSSGCRNNG